MRDRSRTWTSGRHERPSDSSRTAAGRVRPAGEVVEDDVEAEPRRDAVDRRVAHRDDREPVASERREALLRAHLGLGVGGQRLERRPLVEQVVRSRRAVHRAGRREDEPPDAGGLGLSCDAQRRVEVDVVGPLLVEVADRIVGERRQVDDRVEPLEVRGRHVANVAMHGHDRPEVAPEVAPAVEARVEPDDVVARAGDDRREH